MGSQIYDLLTNGAYKDHYEIMIKKIKINSLGQMQPLQGKTAFIFKLLFKDCLAVEEVLRIQGNLRISERCWYARVTIYQLGSASAGYQRARKKLVSAIS